VRTDTHDRLLDTADRLFYDQGVTATGVDAVVRAAGLTKPTLYAHFPSKSALLAAALDRRHTRRTAELEAWVQQVDDVRQRPLAVFGWLESWYEHDGARGCGFLKAAAELTDPGDASLAVVQREKRWLREFLARLCREAGLGQPDRLGSQLLLLVDGVSGRVLVDGATAAPDAVRDAADVARRLVETAGTDVTGDPTR
jgi:AcrR family transcriptional regulator